MASPAAPPPPNQERGRHAPATGRPASDPDRNHDVQQGGKPRRRDRRESGGGKQHSGSSGAPNE